MPPDAPRDAAAGPPSDDAERRAHLAATAEAALPDRAVADVAVLPGEGPHLVGAVTTAGGERFVLKCAAPGADPAPLRREAAVTRFVAERTDVPVPAVLEVDLDPADAPGPYVRFARAGGRSLREAQAGAPRPAQLAMFRSLGETLAALHAGPSFEAPGTVVPTGPASLEVEPAGPWPEAFAGELADRVEALAGSRFEALAEDVWDAAVDRLPALDTGAAPVLLHGDLGDGNVRFAGTAVSCVLDWERASVGHPEYDLCRAEVRYFWNQWGRRDAAASMLSAGYRAARDLADGFDERRPVYLATFYLLSLASFEDWAPRFAGDPDALAGDVAGRVRGLLDAQ